MFKSCFKKIYLFSAIILFHLGANAIVEQPFDAKSALQNLVNDNVDYASKIVDENKYIQERDGQKPRVTMVLCSDSRVHTSSFDNTPVGDLFIIRNIGNQLETAEGSIEYGVNVLQTPILIFIGHSSCGAVKAALKDYSSLSPAMKKEVTQLQLNKNSELNKALEDNTNNQVRKSLSKFAGLVKNKKLNIIGAIYDFENNLGYGHGQLVFINLNGETSPAKIRSSDLFKGLSNANIGIKK